MATKHTSAGQSWQGITHHPLFATVVPLWLAATFALSTLAVRGELIERIVLAAKLDLILPMATPPLGTTARLLLAVAFGLVGALLGWLAVRMMAPRGAFSQTAWQQARRDARKDAERESAPLRRRSADSHPDFPARQPIQAHAELGAHGFDNDPAHAPANAPATEPAAAPGPQMTEAATGPSHAPPPPVAETWQVLHDVPPPPPPAEEPSWDWKPQSTVMVMEKPVESDVKTDKARAEPFMTERFAETVAEAPVMQPFRFFKIDHGPVETAPVETVTVESFEPVAPVMKASPVVQQAPVEAAPEVVVAPVAAAPVVAPVAPPVATVKSCAGFPSLTLDGPSAADHIASASLESLSHVELLARLSLALQRHQNASQETKTTICEPTLAPAPDGTGDALRAALASLRDVK